MWNKVISYTDETPSDRINAVHSLSKTLLKIQSWWGTKLNLSKTCSIINSKSKIPLPPHPNYIITWTSS